MAYLPPLDKSSLHCKMFTKTSHAFSCECHFKFYDSLRDIKSCSFIVTCVSLIALWIVFQMFVRVNPNFQHMLKALNAAATQQAMPVPGAQPTQEWSVSTPLRTEQISANSRLRVSAQNKAKSQRQKTRNNENPYTLSPQMFTCMLNGDGSLF